MVSLEVLVANSSWSSVPDMIRGPAEDCLKRLLEIQLAATGCIATEGRSALKVTDMGIVNALFSEARKTSALASQLLKTLAKAS